MGAPRMDRRHSPAVAWTPWGLQPLAGTVQVEAHPDLLGGGTGTASASVLPFTPALDAFESVAAYAEKRRTGLKAACAEIHRIRSAMS